MATSDIDFANEILRNVKQQKRTDTRRRKAEEDKVRELANQINQTSRDIESAGGEQPKDEGGGGGLLGRALDVISRPNYAIANAARAAVKGDFGDIGKEFVEGATGKDKTTFSTVLEEAGIENKWVKGIGGFVLDVGLDPTTYLSGGSSLALKGGAKGAARTVAKEVGEEVLEAGVKKGVTSAVGARILAKTAEARAAKQVLEVGGKEVGRKVSGKMLDRFVAGGLSGTTEALTEKEIKSISRRFIQDEAYEAALKAGDAEKLANQKAFGIKWRGKPVSGLQSEKLQNIGEAITDRFKSTSLGEGLHKTFQTSSFLPGPLKRYYREAEGYAYTKAEEFDRLIRSTFSGVSKADKRKIADAIEEGKKLPGDLGKLQQEALNIRDSITEIGVANGLIEKDDLIKNYLHHTYRTGNREAAKEFKDTRRILQNPNKGKKGKVQVKSLIEAEQAGLKPVREIDDILRLQGAKNFTEQGRAAYSDNVMREFGVKFAGKDELTAKKLGLVKAKGKYIDNTEGYWVPPEVAHSIKVIEGLYDSASETNNLLRLMDKGLAQWKFGATALNPGHHTRNAVGDMMLNYMDGVSNPLRYKQSMDVWKNPAKTKITIGNKTLTGDEIQSYFLRKGGKTGYTRIEIGGRKFGVTEKIRGFAEGREDWTRMAHFIDAAKKEAVGVDVTNVKNLDEIMSRAAERVRKFNIDYGDLTNIEKKFFKRVAPFYTWMRKNIPLQLEALALRPGRQAVVPKSIKLMQTLVGDDQGYSSIGGLETVPHWIREMSGIKIAGEGEGRNGVYLDPSNLMPSMDALATIAKPTQAILSGDLDAFKDSVSKEAVNASNPVIKMIAESATGKSSFTGADIPEGAAYFQNFLPVVSTASKILNDPGAVTEFGSKPNLALTNWLTGSSFRGVGEEQQLGELKRQQDLYEAAAEQADVKGYKETLQDRRFRTVQNQKANRINRILDTYNDYIKQAY